MFSLYRVAFHAHTHTHAHTQLERAKCDLRDYEEKVEATKQEFAAASSKVHDTKEQQGELMQQKRDLDKAVRESKVS